MLSSFVDSGRLNAALVVALGILLGNLLPPVLLIPTAAVALLVLRHHMLHGLVVAVAAWLAVSAAMLAAGIGIQWVSLLICVVVALMADVLRRSASLELALVVGAGLAGAGLVGFFLVVPDPMAYWQGLARLILQESAQAGAQLTREGQSQFLAMMGSPAWTGIVASISLLICYGGLFIGRSWHARLANPGGFRREFHGLQLGRYLAGVSAICFMVVGLWHPAILLNLAVLLFLLWTIQGLAVIHGMIGAAGASGAWLVPVYLLAIFGWPSQSLMVLVVPFLGLVNQFFDFRQLVRKSKQ